MNKRFAASRLRRDASLPGDLQDPLRKVGLVRLGSGSPLQGCCSGTPIVASMLKSSATKRVKHVALFPGPPFCNALRQLEQAGLLSRISIDRSKQSWFVIADAAIDLS